MTRAQSVDDETADFVQREKNLLSSSYGSPRTVLIEQSTRTQTGVQTRAREPRNERPTGFGQDHEVTRVMQANDVIKLVSQQVVISRRADIVSTSRRQRQHHKSRLIRQVDIR